MSSFETDVPTDTEPDAFKTWAEGVGAEADKVSPHSELLGSDGTLSAGDLARIKSINPLVLEPMPKSTAGVTPVWNGSSWVSLDDRYATIQHGPDSTVVRPNSNIVYWIGTVEPDNAVIDDRLFRPDLNEEYRFNGSNFILIYSGTFRKRDVVQSSDYGTTSAALQSAADDAQDGVLRILDDLNIENVEIPHGVTVEAHGHDIVHETGSGSNPILATKVVGTTCDTTAASADITVADASYARVGAIVAVEAEVFTGVVHDSLNGAIDSSQTTITLNDASEFPNSGKAEIDSEIIEWTGKSGNDLTGVTRGSLGTTAASHTDGTAVNFLTRHYAKIEAISGSTLTLDETMNRTLASATVSLGSVGVNFRGGAYDGAKPTDNAHPILIDQAADSHIHRDVTTKNGDHAGVFCRHGSRDCTVDNLVDSCGDPAGGVGAGVWLFQGVRNCTITARIVGSGEVGVHVDDRTAAATEWDAISEGNGLYPHVDLEASGNAGQSGVNVSGGRSNHVLAIVRGVSGHGVNFASNSQGTTPNVTEYNVAIGCIIDDIGGTGVNSAGARNMLGPNVVRNAGGAAQNHTSTDISFGTSDPSSVSGQYNIWSVLRARSDLIIGGAINHGGGLTRFNNQSMPLAALTTSDGSIVDTTYGQEEADVITNLRTRVNELESRLQTLGLIS